MDLNFKSFGQGPPVVILHGLLGSLDNWQTLGRELADSRHDLLYRVAGDRGPEPAAAEAAPEMNLQFERLGYFVADRHDHRTDAAVFNRSVTLRDTWAARA